MGQLFPLIDGPDGSKRHGAIGRLKGPESTCPDPKNEALTGPEMRARIELFAARRTGLLAT